LTSRGLDKFLKSDNQKLSISWDLDLGLFTKRIQTSYIIFLTLLRECNEVFGIPTNKEKLDLFPPNV